MTPLLGEAGLAVLAGFVRRDTLLAFDYDGTLAPIVADPAEAQMPGSTHALLAQLTRRYATVIITGRSRIDMLRHLAGITSLEVIGNHGLETDSQSGARYARRVEHWRIVLAQELPSIPGLVIENKRFSLAIHYRHCDEPAAARATIERAARTLDDVRLVGGKKVLNLIPAEAPDKGRALLAACERLGCTRALYVGDDETDEDVFTLNRPETVLTIRVGRESGSSARYYIASQDEIDRILEALLERARHAGDPEGAAERP